MIKRLLILSYLINRDLVSFVTHAVWFGRMSFPLGRNAFHCCRRFDIYTDKLLHVTPRFVYDFCIWKVDNESAHLAYSLLELTFVRSGSFSLSKDSADTDIQIMIDALSV